MYIIINTLLLLCGTRYYLMVSLDTNLMYFMNCVGTITTIIIVWDTYSSECQAIIFHILTL